MLTTSYRYIIIHSETWFIPLLAKEIPQKMVNYEDYSIYHNKFVTEQENIWHQKALINLFSIQSIHK